ncbi:MAG: DNA polymerase III subunit delta [Porticoccaceae bacterium]
MPLRPEHLDAHLKDSLASAYLITGDETLLVQEAADQIRATARAQGFSERQIYQVDNRYFDWDPLLAEANSPSLFADKKILEVRLATGKPGDAGSKAIAELCEHLADDNLLLVIAPKLDKASLKTKWAKALDKTGAIIQIWPVNAAQLPRWIDARLKQAGITANRQVVEILAERVEGNLLAAAQEVEKLKLLAPDGKVDASIVSAAVSDSARYNVFDLIDKTLSGDAQGATHVLRGLQEEGVEPMAVLWALTREVRTLARSAEAVANGVRPEQALNQPGVWEQRKTALRKALHRMSPAQANLLLRQIAGTDRAIKGMREASPWNELLDVVLSLSGHNAVHPRNLRLGLSDARDR